MTHPIPVLLAQSSGGPDLLHIALAIYNFIAAFAIVFAILGVLMLIAGWKVFAKAGEPGWAVLVPIYNLVTLFRIGGQSGWWATSVALLMIPIFGWIAYFIIIAVNHVKVARRFGRGAPFGIGLLLLAPVFWCLLGFGDAKYQGETKPA